jgi:hypothetical protein
MGGAARCETDVQIIANLEALLPQRKALVAIACAENVQIVANLEALEAEPEELWSLFPAPMNETPGSGPAFSKGRSITALPVDKGGGGAG